MVNREACESVWRSLLSADQYRTLDDLQEVTDQAPVAILEYLSELMQRGYVRARGIRRADSGEAIPLFRLVNRSGPDAPYLDAEGRWIDPNEERRRAELPKRIGRGQMPSLRARMRFHAEQFPAGFTKQGLREAMALGPSERSAFNKAWKQLRVRREFVILESGLVEVVIAKLIVFVRRALRENTGTDVTAQKLREELGLSNPLTSSTIRSALDLLAAEGYRITITHVNRETIYRVDPPEEAAA